MAFKITIPNLIILLNIDACLKIIRKHENMTWIIRALMSRRMSYIVLIAGAQNLGLATACVVKRTDGRQTTEVETNLGWL